MSARDDNDMAVKLLVAKTHFNFFILSHTQ